ncbi:MAG: tetratricopeptide repeat protein [Chloroflexota bacterium]
MVGREQEFQIAMNQGHSAAWDQLWDRAAGFYRQALKAIPDHPQALTSLGLSLIELQEFDEALRCYLKAAKALPQDPIPVEKIAQLHERLGNLDNASQAALQAAELYLKSRDVQKAIENWERVTRLHPENQRAHTRLAMIFERLGESEKAVREFLALASLFQEAGDLEKANGAVNQALKIIPNSPEALDARSLLKDFKPLPKPERPRGATAPLRMSQVRHLQAPKETSQPDQGMDPVAQACQKALTILAGVLFDAAEDEQGGQRRGLQAIVTGTGMLRKQVDTTRIVLHLSQALDMQARDELAQAAEELLRSIDAGLESSAAHFDLGYLYARLGRVESAIRYLQHAIKNSEFALGAYLLLGNLYRKKNQNKEAAIAYLEALRLADSLMVPAHQANDLRQLYDPFIEAYRQENSESIRTTLLDSISGLLMRPDWRDQLNHARAQLPGSSDLGPPRPLAEMLAEARSSQVIEAISAIQEMARRGQFRSAMEESYYALDHAPTYLPLHTLLGELLIKQGNSQTAVNKFMVIARAYSIRSEAQQAINLYRRVIELSPADLTVHGKLIEQVMAAGQMEQAVEEYIQLAEVYYSLADLSQARKTYTEALRTAQQTDVDRELRVKILHRMADIDMQSLEWRQAMRIFEQIRTLQPDDLKSRSSLVDLNLRLGQEKQALAELDNFLAHLSSHNREQEAVAFLETLAAENPEQVSIRRRLADLHWHLGHSEEALAQLDAIGELLLNAGDRAGAIQTIETILTLGPKNREEYELLLNQLRNGEI